MAAYSAVRPLLFRLSPETAHRLVHGGLAAVDGTPLTRPLASHYTVGDERLAVEAFGQQFPNPVGVAAGFDKNARAPDALAALGFGHVEVGGVTSHPQEGNPRPRLFRLPDDEALVNRMGLNNDGADAVAQRLAAADPPVPVGVNVAKAEDVPEDEAPADYAASTEAVVDGADFVVVNVSCPNSQGFEALQNREELTDILTAVREAGADPLLVKLSPDLPEPAVADALEVVDELDLDGVVATNTTTDRPDGLASPAAAEEGGLSGKPLEPRATRMVRFCAERVDVPIVGVGGVTSAADAYRKIRAGASLVQLYTGLVYRGPSIARNINAGLLELLERDGYEDVESAVGADLE